MGETHSDLLTGLLRTARPVFYYTALFSFFINLLLLLLPLYSLQVLDRVLSTGSMDTLFWLSFIMVAAFFAASVLQALRSFALIRAGEWMENRASRQLLAMSLSHASATGVRGTQNLRDMAVIRGFLTGNGLLTFLDAPWSVISLAVIFMIHPNLGFITLAGCVLLTALAWLNEVAMHKPLDEANEANVRNLHQVDIAMRNAEAIEAMGMAATVAESWQEANHKVTVLQNLASYRSAVVQGVARFGRLTLQIAITGWGAYLALHNEMTSGGIIAASILAGKALGPFDSAIAVWKSLVETQKSYHRLQESLSAMTRRVPGISLPAPRGQLVIDKLFYATPGRPKPILKGISFAMEPGDITGVVGPSAAGKSTLARLCVGAGKPQSGVVRLDGGDVCQWKREEFGRYTGYLPQDIELFSGSVRRNIARMLPDASDESVVRAAQMACAHELIMSLPEGYDTDIGPRGVALSAGQRQRVALARAFYGDPKLLVLDEPDASLDEEGECALMQALHNAKAKSITTLVITHRRKLLDHVDKILVLKEGELMLYGPAPDVMRALTPPPVPQAQAPAPKPSQKLTSQKMTRRSPAHATA